MKNRPDFHQINKVIGDLKKLDAGFSRMFEEAEAQKEAVLDRFEKVRREQSAGLLGEIPVEELKNSRAGIRTASLKEAGYNTLLDLYREKDWKLQSVEGIGEKQIASIRTILDEFMNRLSARGRVRLSPDQKDGPVSELITELARFRNAEIIRRDAEPIGEETHIFIQDTTAAVVIRNRLRWIFSGRAAKEQTVFAVGELLNYCMSPQYGRAQRILELYSTAAGMSGAEAAEDFRKNSADFYALLEKLTGTGAPQEMVYSSIPAQLAARISATGLDLRSFKGNLRAYQTFGAQYILTQNRVLLGDEMGLGKTIQAIAVMSHLREADPKSHFLVVCPASVMINWCREITKFSAVEAHLLHGAFLVQSFEQWESGGGAAVTNYESMGKLVSRINNKMRLSLFVIDEAHYIKNPQAQRTRNIHMLEDESERILMLTGTPLENKVDEMCELIGFVRPDMVGEIRSNAGMRHVPAFREMLAPVYLRRQRDQVLDELPPLTEQEEWCAMTMQDAAAYSAEVMKKSFPGMRRVSFLQDDMRTSAKAARLMELCEQAEDEGRKIVIYSYFRETIRKVVEILDRRAVPETASAASGPAKKRFLGVITGSTPPEERQDLIDRFTEAPDGSILVCQVQAGGTGLNIQAANVVIFCEPQIKPSLTKQAVSRVYRMGQVENVLVCHLLCENTVDEAVMKILEGKQAEFDLFADESVLADAARTLEDKEWIRNLIEEEHRKYLPVPVSSPQSSGEQSM